MRVRCSGRRPRNNVMRLIICLSYEASLDQVISQKYRTGIVDPGPFYAHEECMILADLQVVGPERLVVKSQGFDP